MNVHRIVALPRAAAFSLTLALVLSGCKSTVPAADDASLNTQVQSHLAADQSLAGQPIQASVSNGVVTLNGSVSSDTARTAASGDAAQVSGIKTVVNNLVVAAPSAPVMASVPPPPPMPAPKAQKPSPAIALQHTAPAPIVRNSPAPVAPPQSNPAPVRTQVQPPPPPPTPVIHTITLPAGTDLPIRITQTLDSATTQTGDKFTGVIASDIVMDGMVVLAQGTAVVGHVDAAQDAAHFKGSSLLTLSLSTINRRGERIDIATEPYTKQGEGRGKNTAEKAGGGAAVGAILGGIFGGGKGAAIGAAAGGGVGAGANGITRGQQVQIPSESVVRFRLANAILLHVSSGGGQDAGYGLERRTDQ